MTIEPGKLRSNVQTRHVINVTGAEMLCLTRKCVTRKGSTLVAKQKSSSNRREAASRSLEQTARGAVEKRRHPDTRGSRSCQGTRKVACHALGLHASKSEALLTCCRPSSPCGRRHQQGGSSSPTRCRTRTRA